MDKAEMRQELVSAARRMLASTSGELVASFRLGGRDTHVIRIAGGFLAAWSDTGNSIDSKFYVQGEFEAAARVAVEAASPHFEPPEEDF